MLETVVICITISIGHFFKLRVQNIFGTALYTFPQNSSVPQVKKSFGCTSACFKTPIWSIHYEYMSTTLCFWEFQSQLQDQLYTEQIYACKEQFTKWEKMFSYVQCCENISVLNLIFRHPFYRRIQLQRDNHLQVCEVFIT